MNPSWMPQKINKTKLKIMDYLSSFGEGGVSKPCLARAVNTPWLNVAIVELYREKKIEVKDKISIKKEERESEMVVSRAKARKNKKEAEYQKANKNGARCETCVHSETRDRFAMNSDKIISTALQCDVIGFGNCAAQEIGENYVCKHYERESEMEENAQKTEQETKNLIDYTEEDWEKASIESKKAMIKEKEKKEEKPGNMIEVDKLKDHPLNTVFLPPLTTDQYEGLKERIWIHGFSQEPVEVMINQYGEYILLDGHNRVKICKELGIKEVPFVVININMTEEAEKYIIEKNFYRRQLNSEQQSYLRGRIYEAEKKDKEKNLETTANLEKYPKGNFYPSETPPENQASQKTEKTTHETAKKVAQKFGVSEKTVRNDANFAKAVDKIKESSPEVAQAILSHKSVEGKKITKTEAIELSERARQGEDIKEVLRKEQQAKKIPPVTLPSFSTQGQKDKAAKKEADNYKAIYEASKKDIERLQETVKTLREENKNLKLVNGDPEPNPDLEKEEAKDWGSAQAVYAKEVEKNERLEEENKELREKLAKMSEEIAILKGNWEKEIEKIKPEKGQQKPTKLEEENGDLRYQVEKLTNLHNKTTQQYKESLEEIARLKGLSDFEEMGYVKTIEEENKKLCAEIESMKKEKQDKFFEPTEITPPEVSALKELCLEKDEKIEKKDKEIEKLRKEIVFKMECARESKACFEKHHESDVERILELEMLLDKERQTARQEWETEEIRKLRKQAEDLIKVMREQDKKLGKLDAENWKLWDDINHLKEGKPLYDINKELEREVAKLEKENDKLKEKLNR